MIIIYFELISLLLVSFSENLAAYPNNNSDNMAFPSNFLWGISNSAYQFEGAWNQDGKGLTAWDHLLRKNPNFTVDGSNNSIAANSYNMIEEDVALLKYLNVKVFRTSISWSRILPSADEGAPNKLAINHYRKLFKRLKQNDIEPLVILYHFDLPQKLSDYGGFLNESLAEWFSNYARVCFENFGDVVKLWSTFNEPYVWCSGAYNFGYFAPATTNPGISEYICGHNLLKAHAAVWHMYDKEFRPTQKGNISITFATDWYEPQTKSKDDVESAERQREFQLGWFAHPIYKGNYPSVMIKNIAKISIEEEKRNSSRLPSFTKKEISYIKGTHDIFLFNTYQTYITNSTVTESMKTPSVLNDARSTIEVDPENILKNVKDAVYLDKSNVLGYTVWSISDGFEGINGFSIKLGLSYVDFNSANRTRIPRASAHYYSKICRTGCIYDNCTAAKIY